MAVVVKCVPNFVHNPSVSVLMLDLQQHCEHHSHWYFAPLGRVAKLEHLHANAEQQRVYASRKWNIIELDRSFLPSALTTLLTLLFVSGMQGHLDDIKKVWKLLVGLGVQVRNNTNGVLPYPYKPQVNSLPCRIRASCGPRPGNDFAPSSQGVVSVELIA
jgi:hypothetical protein